MAQRSDPEKKTAIERQQEQGGLQRTSDRSRGLAWRDPFDIFASGPFSMMRRMHEDMDRLFANVGLGRLGALSGSESGWSPAIDVFQRGDEFVVRADVPGMSPDDISVEVGDDALTIRGERKYRP